MKTWNGLLIAVFVSFIILFIVYPKVILSPNSILFTTSNDGLSNYYTYCYHIKHDKEYMSFKGMNYPYGEDIHYVDCHPALANLLKFINQYIFRLDQYSVGILNILMIFSILLCSIFIYLILIHYKVLFSAAIAGSVAISILSSQVLLWNVGHYALSHSWFFPFGWYLLIKYYGSLNKIKWTIFIVISLTFWFFIHNYLGFMLVCFALFFHIFYGLINIKKPKTYLNYILPVIQIIVPVLIVYLSLIITDYHNVRIDLPFNDGYKASFYSVFLPNYSLFRPIYGLFFNLNIQESQSWGKIGNYIGLPTNLFFISIPVILIYLLIIRRFKEYFSGIEISIPAAILSSLVLLLYSMAILYNTKLEKIYEIVPVLSQFISLGRFAWPFFYVSTILCIFFLNRLFSQKYAEPLLLAIAIIYLIEGFPYHFHTYNTNLKTPNIFTENTDYVSDLYEVKDSISFKEFQAILPLPFYHKYNTPGKFYGTEKSQILSMELAYISGLPLFSAHLSRPSIEEGKNIIELFSPVFYQKKIENDISSNKPILILYTNEKLKECEQYLIDRSEIIFKNYEYCLLKLNKDSLFKSNSKYILKKFLETYRGFYYDSINDFYLSKKDSIILYKSFDSEKSQYLYRGKGAFEGDKSKYKVLFTSKPNTFEPYRDYKLSFWYYNKFYDYSFNTVLIEEIDSDNRVVNSYYFGPIDSYIFKNDWAFNEISFTLMDKKNCIKLSTQGADLFSKKVYFDELLIRPSDVDVYKFINDTLANRTLLIQNNQEIISE